VIERDPKRKDGPLRRKSLPDREALALDPLSAAPDSTCNSPRARTVDLKEIKKIVELMNEHGLTLFHLEKEDFNLKLKKGADAQDIREALGSLVAAPAASAGPAPLPAPAQIDAGRSISSPMVGTYYRKPAPDADDFVAVGDKVSEGDILCIIEAMKVMNEIKAETSGTITELCVEDSTPVQYGDVLFRLK
jgi:acetyl-CoA carboxylase biotin carboxyl carrier protein